MKVLVTGATGFIGANLVRALLARGDEVHCIIRKPNAVIDGLDLTLHTIPLLDHPAEVEKLSRVMKGCDVVYHLAGIFDPCIAAKVVSMNPWYGDRTRTKPYFTCLPLSVAVPGV